MGVRPFNPQLLLLGFLGFYSGLPLALTASTLTAWLADAKIDRAAIGLFAAVATPYALKFLWAPLIDGLHLPWLSRLGRRRSWLLLVQALLALALIAMAHTQPEITPGLVALMAVVIATLSATQDIVIDAYRVELLAPEEQGTGAAWATFGYRIGMLVSGAGALALADRFGWSSTYLLMAAVMASGMAVTLWARESPISVIPAEAGIHLSEASQAKKWIPASAGMTKFIRRYVLEPFAEFATRPHWVWILAFVILYKLGDAFMGVMFNPFLLDLGFTKTQIAQIVKLYGLIATILGTFAGGAMVARLGTYRALIMGGLLHMATNLLLVVQAQLGAEPNFLILSIVTENFTGGMSTAAFIAYLSALCRRDYTATQYALLSSLAAFGRTWLSTPSGWLSLVLGWEWFFALASLMALPGLVLLHWLERKRRTY
ncbi:MAG: AmpG family muropeptide MFS transporter [Rickettsiales bacterium]